jgi:glycosyltransferase involved in cell wall biosynthesis
MNINWIHGKNLWAPFEDAKELNEILVGSKRIDFSVSSSVHMGSNFLYHFGDRYSLRTKKSQFFSKFAKGVFVSWHHGNPMSKEYADIFELAINTSNFSSFIVSNRSMLDLISGITPKIFPIHHVPLGVNLDRFRHFGKVEKLFLRNRYQIPVESFVVGSFQKDDIGWGDSNIPKLIKGPDILVESLLDINRNVKNLHVLLTGPSRNFVKQKLSKNGIEYSHFNVSSLKDISNLYACLDAFLITSREEGGPKGLLESMATGVPVVSTEVGMSKDILTHKFNGMLSPIEDSNSIVNNILNIYHHGILRDTLINNGYGTIKNYSWERIAALHENIWVDFGVKR